MAAKVDPAGVNNEDLDIVSRHLFRQWFHSIRNHVQNPKVADHGHDRLTVRWLLCV